MSSCLMFTSSTLFVCVFGFLGVWAAAARRKRGPCRPSLPTAAGPASRSTWVSQRHAGNSSGSGADIRAGSGAGSQSASFLWSFSCRLCWERRLLRALQVGLDQGCQHLRLLWRSWILKPGPCCQDSEPARPEDSEEPADGDWNCVFCHFLSFSLRNTEISNEASLTANSSSNAEKKTQ